MTVLAVKNYKDRIELAADSGVFNGWWKEENFIKIVEINNMIFMSAGSVSEQNLLELFCVTRKPESNQKLDILRFFSEFRNWQIKEFSIKFEDGDIIKNEYFFYFDHKIFKIGHTFTISEILEGEFSSEGAGRQEAKTALYLGHSPKEAVDICVKLNVWTAGKTQEKVILK